MRSLVNVDAALIGISSRYQQPGSRFADELVTKDGVELVPKRGCFVLGLDQVTQGGTRIPGLSSEPTPVSRLPEDRRPTVFVEFQKGLGPDAEGESDRENTSG